MGDYQFSFNEYYQLIFDAREDRITGSICQLKNQRVTRIATFLTGNKSLIRAGSSNGIALEHFGMDDPGRYKSEIIIRNPLRIDVEGVESSAKGGLIKYQECSNSNISRDSNVNIILSHGGDSVRGNSYNEQFLKWS